MTDQKKDPFLDLSAEMAKKLPPHDCCEMCSRYILSDFFVMDDPNTFSGVIEHLIKDHGSLEAANMAVAIYQLNRESALREKELFAQYKINFPPRYAQDVSDAESVVELKARLKAMMPKAAEHQVH